MTTSRVVNVLSVAGISGNLDPEPGAVKSPAHVPCPRAATQPPCGSLIPRPRCGATIWALGWAMNCDHEKRLCLRAQPGRLRASISRPCVV
jgi:hypothetical protein